jgi:hypothetical protein
MVDAFPTTPYQASKMDAPYHAPTGMSPLVFTRTAANSILSLTKVVIATWHAHSVTLPEPQMPINRHPSICGLFSSPRLRSRGGPPSHPIDLDLPCYRPRLGWLIQSYFRSDKPTCCPYCGTKPKPRTVLYVIKQWPPRKLQWVRAVVDLDDVGARHDAR